MLTQRFCHATEYLRSCDNVDTLFALLGNLGDNIHVDVAAAGC